MADHGGEVELPARLDAQHAEAGLREERPPGPVKTMAAVSEQRFFDALATVARAFADGGVPAIPGVDAVRAAGAAGPSSPAIAAMDDEAREGLDEAALAIAFA